MHRARRYIHSGARGRTLYVQEENGKLLVNQAANAADSSFWSERSMHCGSIIIYQSSRIEAYAIVARYAGTA